MNLKFDIAQILKLIGPMQILTAFGAGDKARDGVERALTIPEAKIRPLCKGMTEEDTAETIACFREGADRYSDGLALIASKGAVQPD